MNTAIKNTFKTLTLTAAAAFFSLGSVSAQSDVEISDEKITAYIVVMDSVDVLSSQLSEDIGTKIKEHELLDGGRAYQKIQSAKGDSVKIAEEGITAEQLEAYQAIMDELDTRKEELNEIFTTLVKEKVGAAEYNEIKRGLKSDPELKERYKALEAEVEEEKTASSNPANSETEGVN